MSSYRETRYWCVARDCDVARLSMVDGHGQEYFAIEPVTRKWRDRRDSVLALIEEAIERGDAPGEVNAVG